MTKAKRGEPLAWIKANAAYQGDDCLVWPFGQSYGYGNVRWNGRTIASHRLMCLMVHGPAPEGCTDAAHKCGNKLCCNPRHLKHATASENQRDKIEHGTILRGESHSLAKLSEGDVRAIRTFLSQGEKSQSEIARMYGVTHKAIAHIKTGANWAWLS